MRMCCVHVNLVYANISIYMDVQNIKSLRKETY